MVDEKIPRNTVITCINANMHYMYLTKLAIHHIMLSHMCQIPGLRDAV